MIKLFRLKEQGANSATMLWLFLSGDMFPSSLSPDKNKMPAIVLKIYALEFARTASYKVTVIITLKPQEDQLQLNADRS